MGMRKGAFFFYFIFLFFYSSCSVCVLTLFPAKQTTNRNKKNFSTLVELDLVSFPGKSTFSLCFWFAEIAQGARQRAYAAEKNPFPFCFWFAKIAQGARQRAYADGKATIRTKKNLTVKKDMKYEIFFLFKKWNKKKCVTVTLYLQIWWNTRFWSNWEPFFIKRKLFPNGNGAPDAMEHLP